jgi:hypothetical protein
LKPRRDEVVELHLADRPLAGERRADADAEHAPSASGELMMRRRTPRAAAAAAGTRCRTAADVLAVDEYAWSERSASATPSATASRNVWPFVSNGSP